MTPFSREEEPLLTGTNEAVGEFIDADRCIVLDWRGEEEDTLWNVQQWLPEGALDYQIVVESITGNTTITLRFRDREHTYTLPPRSLNSFRSLLPVEKILLPDYEIKLFRCTEGDDTHAFLLRPAEWWLAFRKDYPERYTETFSDLKTLNSLWDLEAAPQPLTEGVPQHSPKPWWKLW